jgi:hypothetical protein
MAKRQQLSTDKHLNEVIDDAVRNHGAVVSYTGSGHIKVKLPNGRSVVTAFSPSDRRAALNIRAHIRRALQENDNGR